MQIYICDDNDLDRERVLRMLKRYAGRFGSRLKISKFPSAEKMFSIIEKNGTRPDLVFLDIYMENMDGIEAGEKLKTLFGGEIPVIFSTSSDEHAIHAFGLRAAGYLHKPYTQKDFDHALNRLERLFRDSARLLNVWQSEKERTCKVWLEDILWLETEGRGTRIHLADIPESMAGGAVFMDKKGNVSIFTTSPLKTFRESLGQERDFYECGRSCILHLTAANGMEDDGVRMKNGAFVPVPVRLKAELTRHLEDWRKYGGEDCY